MKMLFCIIIAVLCPSLAMSYTNSQVTPCEEIVFGDVVLDVNGDPLYDHWDRQCLSPKTSFARGESVSILVKGYNMTDHYRFKLVLSKDGIVAKEVEGTWVVIMGGETHEYGTMPFSASDFFVGEYDVKVSIQEVDDSHPYELFGETTISISGEAYYNAVTYIAESWKHPTTDVNAPNYWDLEVTGVSDHFEVDSIVCIVPKAEEITEGHEWALTILKNGADWYSDSYYHSDLDIGIGQSYTNFPYCFYADEDATYTAQVTLDVDEGIDYFSEQTFTVGDGTPSVDPDPGHDFFTAPSITICEGVKHPDGSVEGDDNYWDLEAINPGHLFYEGDKVVIRSRAEGLLDPFQWKTLVYKDRVLLDPIYSDHYAPVIEWPYSVEDAGYNAGSIGVYVTKSYITIDGEDHFVGSDSFEIKRRVLFISFTPLVCEGVKPGASDSTDDEYRNTQPVNPGTEFGPGLVYSLVKAAEIFVPHYWVTYFYFGDSTEPMKTKQSELLTPLAEGMRYSPWYVPVTVVELGSYRALSYLIIDDEIALEYNVAFEISEAPSEEGTDDTNPDEGTTIVDPIDPKKTVGLPWLMLLL